MEPAPEDPPCCGRGLGDDGVSECVDSIGPISVQFMGRPIIHSTKRGLRRSRPCGVIPTVFATPIPLPCLIRDVRPLTSRACGVGRRPPLAIVVSSGRTAAPFDGDRLTRVSDVSAMGVGSKQEEPIAEVRGADGGRWYAVPIRSPPARGQITEDPLESHGKQPWNILQEEVRGTHSASDAPYLVPEPPLVVGPGAATGDADGLTREPRSDEIHDSTPWRRVECGEVVPDRSLIQGLVCHPCHEHGRAVGLPLDSAHKTMVGSGELDSEIEPADPGAESEGT
jgi:hypothetical protein